MYCKIFASLYQGTLRGQANEILVFTNLLAHCDRDGFVDKHFRAIAEETGLTEAQVRDAVLNLEAPDPESRSPECGGSRIVRLDPHRVWGWRVVNHQKYRNLRHETDRREQNRTAQKKWRDKHKSADVSQASADVSQSKPPSALSANADADTDADADTRGDTPLEPPTAKIPPPTTEPKKRDRKPKPPKPEPVLPFDSPEFSAAWALWRAHRAEKRVPLTNTSIGQQFANLAALGEARAIAAIHHSIANSYTGIYEPSPSNGSSNGRVDPALVIARQAAEAMQAHQEAANG